MSVFDILTMVGGLALFLYGMEVMGNGLSKASGGRMERILEKMTDNIFKAVLLGAGVTAVIQSSSATTVIGNDGYGRWLCEFRYYEAVSGSWCYYGCQYRYNRDIMAFESDRYSGGQFYSDIDEAVLFFTDSGRNRRRISDVFQE